MLRTTMNHPRRRKAVPKMLKELEDYNSFPKGQSKRITISLPEGSKTDFSIGTKRRKRQRRDTIRDCLNSERLSTTTEFPLASRRRRCIIDEASSSPPISSRTRSIAVSRNVSNTISESSTHQDTKRPRHSKTNYKLNVVQSRRLITNALLDYKIRHRRGDYKKIQKP